MLLFRHQKSTRAKTFFAVLMLVTSSLLCSCSYSPLYGQRAGSDLIVTKNFELIEIQPIKDRIGQTLRNYLLVHLNPTGKPANPLYKLKITLEETRLNLGVKKSAVVTRGNLKVLATFTLSKASNKITGIGDNNIFTSKVTAISSYDIPQAQYAALAAIKDAQARALRNIADNIRTRLGIYFSQGK